MIYNELSSLSINESPCLIPLPISIRSIKCPSILIYIHFMISPGNFRVIEKDNIFEACFIVLLFAVFTTSDPSSYYPSAFLIICFILHLYTIFSNENLVRYVYPVIYLFLQYLSCKFNSGIQQMHTSVIPRLIFIVYKCYDSFSSALTFKSCISVFKRI